MKTVLTLCLQTLVSTLLFIHTDTQAQDNDNVVELSATVTGNQEQPKVIYIVPWKPAEDDSILYQPLNGKTDSVFGHVERSEHRRELKFIYDMEAKTVSK